MTAQVPNDTTKIYARITKSSASTVTTSMTVREQTLYDAVVRSHVCAAMDATLLYSLMARPLVGGRSLSYAWCFFYCLNR